jgi:hypothetical protein
MKLIGFNFTKISVEKIGKISKDLKINTSINIDSIDEVKNEMIKSKDTFLNIKFNYKINYDPKIALIDFSGNIAISVDSKTGKEILKDWKSKKIDDNNRIIIFNAILRKSNVKALQLEEEMNLPLHFQLPSLKSKKE